MYSSMDKEKYTEDLCNEVIDCLEGSVKHAVLIVFDDSTGQVKTYAINASYDTVQMLVSTAALVVGDATTEERVMH